MEYFPAVSPACARGTVRVKTVAHCISPYLQTAGPWIYEQIRRAERYRPVVFTQGAINLDAYPVETLHSAEAFGVFRTWSNRLWRKARNEYLFYDELVEREEVALLHAHFGYEGGRLLRAQQRSGRPLLTTFYGADATEYARYPRWMAQYRRLFERGALFLAEGGAMAERLVSLGCPADKVRVWHLGVDVERIAFVERKRSEHVRLLICAGFKEKKGIPWALRGLAMALQRAPFDYSLTLIGDGDDRSDIEREVDALGLRPHTSFRGMLPYAQVVDELSLHDILLQTSVTAANGDGEGGAPVILLDAQASGMPIVGSTHADIPEYVRDGESGFLAEERDVEGIAERIQWLVERADWAAMGRAGRRHVETEYSAQRQTQALELIYDEVQ
jgi:colanic acid/amylovoran biosynthesis glycosyltransferase